MAESTKSIVHYTFPTPNGIVGSILLEELKVRPLFPGTPSRRSRHLTRPYTAGPTTIPYT